MNQTRLMRLEDFTQPPEIELAVGWAHHQLEPDFNTGRNVWRVVTEEFFYEMLGALPPIDMKGPQFLVGEPHTFHGSDTVYCGCVKIGERYFARYVPRKQFERAVAVLRETLAKDKAKADEMIKRMDPAYQIPDKEGEAGNIMEDEDCSKEPFPHVSDRETQN